MRTVKETEEQSVKNQLILAVRNLIECMNSASDLNIEIVEEETSETSFVFSLEYPPYENNRQGFQRRVSSIDTNEFIHNVFDNIEEIMGFNYKRGGRFIKSTTPDGKFKRGIVHDSSANSFYISTHKKVHIRIHFVKESN